MAGVCLILACICPARDGHCSRPWGHCTSRTKTACALVKFAVLWGETRKDTCSNEHITSQRLDCVTEKDTVQ